ncbi:MAG: hypothetical protein ABSH01_09805 [Terriglobia bacterium]|jgi:hypothetical protein
MFAHWFPDVDVQRYSMTELRDIEVGGLWMMSEERDEETTTT